MEVLSEGVGSLEGTVDEEDNDTACSDRGCSLSAKHSSYMFPQKERLFRTIWSCFQMGWNYSEGIRSGRLERCTGTGREFHSLDFSIRTNVSISKAVRRGVYDCYVGTRLIS